MGKESREIRKKFIQLVWPVIIQNSLMMLMFNIDTAMIGRLDEASLAAMGIIGPVRWAIMAVMMGIAIGTLATIARSVGANEWDRAERFAATSYFLSLFVGIVTTVAIATFAFRIPAVFIDDPDVVREAGKYLRITFLFFSFTYASMIGSSILRAAGDTRTPMIVSVISNILNIAGNYILIFGKFGFPALGLYGAGLSTGICKCFEGILMTGYIFTRRSVVRLRPSSFRMINRTSIKELLKISIPAGSEPFFVNSGFLVFTKIVAQLGTFAVAANRIALAVESLAFMPGHAFSTTCATLVGQKIGEKSPSGVKKSVKQSLTVSLVTTICIGLVFLVFPHYLCMIFTNDKKIIAMAALCLMIGAAEQPFLGMSQIFKGAFQGSGDTHTPIYLGAIGVWGPRVCLSWFFGLYLGIGLPGIWVATTLDWITRSSLYYWRYRVKMRKLRQKL